MEVKVLICAHAQRLRRKSNILSFRFGEPEGDASFDAYHQIPPIEPARSSLLESIAYLPGWLSEA